MSIRIEQIVLWIALLLLTISFSSLASIRYAFYFAPLAVFALWAVSPDHTLRLHNPVLPFLWLVLLGIVSLWDMNVDTFKRTVFVAVYTSLFVLFDFTRAHIDTRRLAVLFIVLFGFTVAIGATKHTGTSISLLDSASPYESTLAFPLGLCALALLIERRWWWSLALFVLTVLALKRIVLIGLVLSAAVWLSPTRLRRLLLHPIVLVCATVLGLVASLALANGYFDTFIWEQFHTSSNAFTKGRQHLWQIALNRSNFEWDDYLMWGLGLGGTVTGLKEALHLDRVLLHNDLLSLVLDVGLLNTFLFIVLLVTLKSEEQRLFAGFLLLILLTDNVLIYQHVMVPYLLFQHHLEAMRRINPGRGLAVATTIRCSKSMNS